MKAKGSPLLRLERASQAAQSVAVAKAKIESEERMALIRNWDTRRLPFPEEDVSDEEMNHRIVIMARELLYQFERDHGAEAARRVPPFPLSELPPSEAMPLPCVLSGEEWKKLSAREVAGACKWILSDGESTS